MTDYGEGHRHYRITSDSHGAKVLAAAYIMLCQTVLSILARAGIKLSTPRKWSWDDTAVAVASIFALGHTGSMAASYKYGLGRRMSAGGSLHWNSLEQTFYASNLLYLVTIILAKISILLFIRRLTPSRSAARICWAFFIFLSFWGVSALLIELFACGLPAPWWYDSDHCIDLSAFTRSVTIVDMISDLLLVALPIYLFAGLNYSGSSRWTIITVFSMRAFIIIPSTLRLLAISDAFNFGSRGDASWNFVPYEVWTTVVVHFSVISASIPCVRPLLRSLESGLYDVSLKVHPRLARASEDVEKNFMLMTLSGWSVRKGVDMNNGGSISTNATQKQPLRPSRLMRNRPEGLELERQQSISSEAEFSRKLHPETAEHKTKIQSMRTYPQFGKLSAAAARGSGKKKLEEYNEWGDIAVTKETSIRFESEGVVLQELNTRLTNH